jgi:hypothetical protein
VPRLAALLRSRRCRRRPLSGPPPVGGRPAGSRSSVARRLRPAEPRADHPLSTRGVGSGDSAGRTPSKPSGTFADAFYVVVRRSLDALYGLRYVQGRLQPTRRPAIFFGFIDRASALGRDYLMHRAEHVFYRDATFYSAAEVDALLRESGFADPLRAQTVSVPPRANAGSRAAAPRHRERRLRRRAGNPVLNLRRHPGPPGARSRSGFSAGRIAGTRRL